MNLYTVLIDFEDRTTGIEQFEAESPFEAPRLFSKNALSLEHYPRASLLSIVEKRHSKDELLIHIANNMKGLWIVNFGLDCDEDINLSSIYGGYIIQTDKSGPIRSLV